VSRPRLLAWCACAAALAGAPAAQAGVDAALRALLADARLDRTRIGVHVVDLADGTVLARHAEDRGVMPASNLKLVSAAVALSTLGPEFAFTTEVAAHGSILDGVLDGDLVLRGAGDPTLGGQHEIDPRAPLAALAHRLRAEHGLREVLGAVLGDGSWLPEEGMGEGWSWDDHAADYAAPLSGLCFAENVVRIELLPTAAGRRPGMRLSPETTYLDLEAAVVAGDPPTAIDVQRDLGGNRVRLGGRIAAGSAHRVAVSVDRPSAFAAHVLRECLRDAGILVRGPAVDLARRPGRLTGPLRPLAAHTSPPLRAVLPTLLEQSQNLYAEQLLRAAARAATGKAGMADAARHAAEVLRGLGVDPEGLVLADGSGLSRLNLVQPRQLTALLAAMWRGEHRVLWLEALPLAGREGTLAERFPSGPAHGRVLAKTGHIRGVVALSGYVPRPDPSDAPLVFAVLLNDFACTTDAAKAAVDAFVQELARAAGW